MEMVDRLRRLKAGPASYDAGPAFNQRSANKQEAVDKNVIN